VLLHIPRHATAANPSRDCRTENNKVLRNPVTCTSHDSLSCVLLERASNTDPNPSYSHQGPYKKLPSKSAFASCHKPH